MRLSSCSSSFGALGSVLRRALRGGLCCALLLAGKAGAALPPTVARAFHDQRIPLNAVSAYVQEIGAVNSVKPLLIHRPSQPMNPTSTMKLVTTFAGLDLLGPDYRWKTEAYADGPIVAGVLAGDLVLTGRGDRRRAATTLQRRPGRARRQLQERALYLCAQSCAGYGRGARRAATCQYRYPGYAAARPRRLWRLA